MGCCPLCGGNVVKTCKGYRCEHNIGEQPSCVLNINAIIGNRKMEDDEIAELLEKRFILLDGFATKEGKTFPTVLELTDDGAINMQAVIAKCPHCGGDIRVGSRAFNCSNYGNQEAPCNFSIWRNIGGHQVTLAEAKKSVRRVSQRPNWKCTGKMAPFTVNGWGFLPTNFKSSRYETDET